MRMTKLQPVQGCCFRPYFGHMAMTRNVDLISACRPQPPPETARGSAARNTVAGPTAACRPYFAWPRFAAARGRPRSGRGSGPTRAVPNCNDCDCITERDCINGNDWIGAIASTAIAMIGNWTQ